MDDFAVMAVSLIGLSLAMLALGSWAAWVSPSDSDE
jgi:hypothetical protein